jgi:DNA polymerase-1
MFRNAFERDLDLHSVVATEMFGVPVSKDQNAELRQRAKAINFGLVYGMGAAALGSQVGAAGPEAQALLDRYFERFPKIRGYLEGSVDDALARGYAETVLGRRLVFDQETLALDNARGELSRIAKNMPIQGTSADMTKLAMVRVHERLLAEFGDAGLINTVHDELVVECRAHDAERVARAVGEEMSAAHTTLLRHVPPKVEVTAAPHWQH